MLHLYLLVVVELVSLKMTMLDDDSVLINVVLDEDSSKKKVVLAVVDFVLLLLTNLYSVLKLMEVGMQAMDDFQQMKKQVVDNFDAVAVDLQLKRHAVDFLKKTLNYAHSSKEVVRSSYFPSRILVS